jgi:hypothetical protein
MTQLSKRQWHITIIDFGHPLVSTIFVDFKQIDVEPMPTQSLSLWACLVPSHHTPVSVWRNHQSYGVVWRGNQTRRIVPRTPVASLRDSDTLHDSAFKKTMAHQHNRCWTSTCFNNFYWFQTNFDVEPMPTQSLSLWTCLVPSHHMPREVWRNHQSYGIVWRGKWLPHLWRKQTHKYYVMCLPQRICNPNSGQPTVIATRVTWWIMGTKQPLYLLVHMKVNTCAAL